MTQPSSGVVGSPASQGRRPPRSSFETHLAEIADAAYSVAVVLARTGEAAAVLLQETAVAAWGAFGGRPASTDFAEWFLGHLVRTYRQLRAAGRLPGGPEADLDDTPDLYLYGHLAAAGALDDGPDPAAELFERLGTERLMCALDRLPEDYRLVTVLYYLEAPSYEALASITGLPVGAVRARLHRGRKMLQRAVWEVAGGRELAIRERETGR